MPFLLQENQATFVIVLLGFQLVGLILKCVYYRSAPILGSVFPGFLKDINRKKNWLSFMFLFQIFQIVLHLKTLCEMDACSLFGQWWLIIILFSMVNFTVRTHKIILHDDTWFFYRIFFVEWFACTVAAPPYDVHFWRQRGKSDKHSVLWIGIILMWIRIRLSILIPIQIRLRIQIRIRMPIQIRIRSQILHLFKN